MFDEVCGFARLRCPAQLLRRYPGDSFPDQDTAVSGCPGGKHHEEGRVNTYDPSELTLIGHFGGVTGSLFVRGPILYAGFGPEFAALDVSMPERPTRVGYVVLEGSVTDIQVVDVLAYVAVVRKNAPLGARGAIYVLDVTDPTNIQVVSSFVTRREPYEIAVTGKQVLATAEEEGLLIVDMTDLSHPRLSSSLPPPPLEGHGESFRKFVGHVAVEGSFACITGVDMDILDISQSSPRRIGHYEARKRGGENLEIRNGYAYWLGELIYGWVGEEWVGSEPILQVIDISDPASPREIAVYHSGEDAVIQDLALDDNLAFIVSLSEDGTAGSLRIVDVSSPEHPMEKGRFERPASSVAAKQPFVYLSCGHVVDILDISRVSAPTITGRYLAPSEVFSVVLRGQFAYIAGWGGLFIANISDPQNVYGVRSFVNSDLRPIHNLAVAGKYAYLAEGQRAVDDFEYEGMGGAVQIIDISSPSNPAPLGFLALPDDGSAKDIEVEGNTAFVYWEVVDEQTGTSVLEIDISDPANPKVVHSQVVPKGASEIEMSGNRLHIREEALELDQPAPETTDSSDRSMKIHGPDEFAEKDGVIYRTGNGLSLYRRK